MGGELVGGESMGGICRWKIKNGRVRMKRIGCGVKREVSCRLVHSLCRSVEMLQAGYMDVGQNGQASDNLAFVLFVWGKIVGLEEG